MRYERAKTHITDLNLHTGMETTWCNKTKINQDSELPLLVSHNTALFSLNVLILGLPVVLCHQPRWFYSDNQLLYYSKFLACNL